MKQVVWMAAGCVGSWLVAVGVAGRPVELLLGMLGPLLAASLTWLAVERAARRDPARITRVMMGGFGLKMLFFGVYVVAISRLGHLDFAAFAAAFVVYFVALYVVQAFLLRGLSVPQAS